MASDARESQPALALNVDYGSYHALVISLRPAASTWTYEVKVGHNMGGYLGSYLGTGWNLELAAWDPNLLR